MRADPAEYGPRGVVGRSHACDGREQDAESDGHRVPLMRTSRQTLGLYGVHHRENQQIEHAAAEYVTSRDVR
jgi:hypothetical protein